MYKFITHSYHFFSEDFRHVFNQSFVVPDIAFYHGFHFADVPKIQKLPQHANRVLFDILIFIFDDFLLFVFFSHFLSDFELGFVILLILCRRNKFLFNR